MMMMIMIIIVVLSPDHSKLRLRGDHTTYFNDKSNVMNKKKKI